MILQRTPGLDTDGENQLDFTLSVSVIAVMTA